MAGWPWGTSLLGEIHQQKPVPWWTRACCEHAGLGSQESLFCFPEEMPSYSNFSEFLRRGPVLILLFLVRRLCARPEGSLISLLFNIENLSSLFVSVLWSLASHLTLLVQCSRTHWHSESTSPPRCWESESSLGPQGLLQEKSLFLSSTTGTVKALPEPGSARGYLRPREEGLYWRRRLGKRNSEMGMKVKVKVA